MAPFLLLARTLHARRSGLAGCALRVFKTTCKPLAVLFFLSKMSSQLRLRGFRSLGDTQWHHVTLDRDRSRFKFHILLVFVPQESSAFSFKTYFICIRAVDELISSFLKFDGFKIFSCGHEGHAGKSRLNGQV